jgi:hypothetical protein
VDVRNSMGRLSHPDTLATIFFHGFPQYQERDTEKQFERSYERPA